MKRIVESSTVCLLLLIVGLASAHAQWIPNGVAAAPSLDPVPGPPQIVPDGSGGAIIAWQDSRNASGKDIYVQRVSAGGAVLWTADGVPVCTAAGDQANPHLVPDGMGGAIVSWEDNRGGNDDIYAQRVDSTGAVLWAANGVAVCTAASDQDASGIASDGMGGAIVSWEDYRGGNYDIYAQRVGAGGAVLWTTDGVPVCVAANTQSYPAIAADGSGGAVITWQDYRGQTSDIYAQRLDDGGAALWAADGLPLCTAGNTQAYPVLAADGSGGAIVAWQDYRNGTTDIYAARVDGSGAVAWTADGVPVCVAVDAQTAPQIVADGFGGAVVAWRDNRSGNTDIYAERMDAGGTPEWAADGVAVCAAANIQYYQTLIPNGSGGAIITWQDHRAGSFPDIYAQEMSAGGVARWAADGVVVCEARYSQAFPVIVPDASMGAVIAWQDRRGGGYGELYAERIDSSGVAQWTPNDVGVCTAPNTESLPAMAPDGSGGAIIAWQDRRTGIEYDIYAQRVDADGVVLWAADGIAICTADSDQTTPAIVADGSGGAIITWEDSRGGSKDIYAQRVSASGITEWIAGGVAICAADDDQVSPEIIADGSGGAFLAWEDHRGGTAGDIYAQRVAAAGTVVWAADGVPICTASYEQSVPRIAPDGALGAIVVWEDARSGVNNDIYAQRVDAGGTAQWTANGIPLCEAEYSQSFPVIVSDGALGAIVAWEDHRAAGYGDIYAQRVNADGGVAWTPDGVAVCAATDDQESPRLVSDGSGGGIVAWQDYRSGTNYDTYAQRVDGDGGAMWATDGVAVSTAANNQRSPEIATDGAAGAIVTWRDNRGGEYYDIYAQRMSAGGTVQWTIDGTDICTAPYSQEGLRIVTDGAGGAIIAWQDHRDGISTRIYAERARGEDLGPVCSVEPLVIDPPSPVQVGSSRDTTFTIENLGVGVLSGTVGEACDPFEIVSGGTFSLAQGESQVVTVRFEPVAPGTFDCTIGTGTDICGDVSITGVAVELPPDSVIYVDADATGGSGGSSWTNAFTGLADALALAPSCPNVTQIWVAEGTYRPTAESDRSASFGMQSGLGIYGGFSGVETARSQRNPETHVTVLSGDIGTPGDVSDNSYHVVTGIDANSAAVLDGFTLTGGNADGGAPDERSGGGMFIESGSPTIANVRFVANSALSSGGGLYNGTGCAPKLFNVLFAGNGAFEEGGGICNASWLSLVNASFYGNVAGEGGGGGFCNTTGSPVIVNTIMWGDTASCAAPHENCGEFMTYGGEPNFSYSLVEGSGGSAAWDAELGTDAGSNIDADPLYVGAPDGDLRLLIGSPAIDGGNAAFPGLPETDLGWSPRVQGASIDMGAYEGNGVFVLYTYARMDSLVDVPNDQGGWLRIYFTRSSLDDTLETVYPIARYDVHRRVDEPGLLARVMSEGETIRGSVLATLPDGGTVSLVAPSSDAKSTYVRCDDRYFLVNEPGAEAAAPPGTWEVVGNVSAQQQNQYIRLAPTLGDSASTITWSVFYISAHTTTPSVYYNSPPDSGYSVDNIAPGVPTGLMIVFGTGNGNQLRWDPCAASDFQYFRVYRGADPAFVPAPENLAGATERTFWTDPDYDVAGISYKVTALDHAGNESPPASPESTTGAGDHSAPVSFALYQNAPNPFNPETAIRYDVPAPGGKVTLKVFDVSGRLVRTLVDGTQTAGRHTVRWNGKNDEGQGVASGIYFCRMTAPGFTERRKLVLMR